MFPKVGCSFVLLWGDHFWCFVVVFRKEKKGISSYTGKASVAQGSLMLSAEKIQLFSNQTQVIKMIANGNKKQRAHYQQSQPTQPRFIAATASKITYLIQKQTVHLKGNAWF